MDGVHAPFESIIEWDAFSVRLREEAVNEMLPEVREGWRVVHREGGSAAVRRFQWGTERDAARMGSCCLGEHRPAEARWLALCCAVLYCVRPNASQLSTARTHRRPTHPLRRPRLGGVLTTVTQAGAVGDPVRLPNPRVLPTANCSTTWPSPTPPPPFCSRLHGPPSAVSPPGAAGDLSGAGGAHAAPAGRGVAAVRVSRGGGVGLRVCAQ